MPLKSRDAIYAERDQLVVALSKLFPAHLCRHVGADWEDEWRNIVCVHLPAGQVTWHVPDAELPWFRHLKMAGSHWDGHTTDEKYQRLNALPWDGTPGTRCLAERWEFVEHAYLGGRAWEVTFRCDRKHGHVGAHSYEGVEFEAIPALPKPWTTCDATAT